MTGRVEAIWIKRARRGPMDAVERARLIEGRGIEGNADQGGLRQVTIIEKEVFEGLDEELRTSLDPAARRANLMISGVPLAGARDRLLRVGPCLLHLRGETRPCEWMDEAHQGLREALGRDWRGGVFGAVVQGGDLTVGDPVSLEPASTTPAGAGG